ncbi:MAG: serine hydrolase domain-containing protein [Actinomycetota bacterium]|nr:serine hydrolase domain-containing protein [Actinomycetota bacterium]
MDAPISGQCDARFAAVREAFAANFAERGEVGAAVCVMVNGHVVVDLVGGWADAGRTRPWQPDTMVNFYSVGKAVVALLALQLVDDGVVGLDDPIERVWPEFAVGGKEAATLRMALCHQAGVPAIRRRLTNDDLWQWQRMADALAATAAWFLPGSRHMYHTNTYGHLVGEIVRRASGQMPGERLRNLTAPLAADVYWGLTTVEQARCAELIWAPPHSMDGIDPFAIEGEAHIPMMSYFNPPGYASNGVVNTAEWRGAQVPSTNGHGTATGLARVYAALIQPGRLLSADLLAEATRVQSEGPCPVLGEEVAFGLGFTPTSARRPLGTNPRSFGHFGTGGSLAFGDPDAGVAFGYVMNHVIPRWQSTRNRALIDALYDAL